MSEQKRSAPIGFAVELPQEVAAAIVAANDRGDVLLSVRTDDRDPSDLRFDPFGGPDTWLVVKFLSDAAVAVALNLLSDFIYERMKERRADGGAKTFAVRLSNGDIIDISVEEPFDVDRFRIISGLG